ncbi:hypothetical protein [Amycolatopsis sp. NPDC051903]|uniref:hypothetical protein n=1 Tax=Amycolatopsis sp. NPDC051903 TaxID=3363936 RepID=UPI0037929174
MIIGAHSPEFPVEREVEKVWSTRARPGVTCPIAIDNDFADWRALCFADAGAQANVFAFD